MQLIAELNNIDNVTDSIKSFLHSYKIILLKGNLGSGKTTLCKHLLPLIGVAETISSPTFTIVNTYKTKDYSYVHHFDLYRIKHSDELIEIGFMEYLESGNWCIIEWPEIAINYIDLPYLLINIEHDEDKRVYTLSEINKVK